MLGLLACSRNDDGTLRDCGWCDCSNSPKHGKHVWDYTTDDPCCLNCGKDAPAR
jgi:hypothetical protein